MTFASWVNSLVNVLSSYVVPVIIALAVLVFLWGVVNYFFLNAGDEQKRTESRAFILWGILGLVVLFSVWGLVNILLSTLGIAPSA
jgi:hypothetical protein